MTSGRRTFAAWIAAVALGTLGTCVCIRAGAAPAAQTWLVLSDVHLDPFDRRVHPGPAGSDTNVALFRSAVAQMRRSVPHPAVVLLPGDFLAHEFAARAAQNDRSAEEAALAAMRYVAGALAGAFPNARFAVTLGNNDAPCGDYRTAFATRYAGAVARIWEPLVNRGGAAADFASSFAATGSYTMRLPLGAVRLIAFDDVPLSSAYAGNCTAGAGQSDAQLAWLRRVLGATPRGTRNVVLMHVPPGYDAFSTEMTHGYVPVPFLDARGDAALRAALGDPRNAVALAIAGHAHRFDFRLAGAVPIIVFGSLSPVYRSNPAFYAIDVAPDGTPRDIRTFAFDEATGAWQPARRFDAMWRVPSPAAVSLRALHDRLGNDARMRRVWDAASAGWPSSRSAAAGLWGARWRIAWCAQVLDGSGFVACANLGERAELFRVALAVMALCLGTSIAGVTILATRRPSPGAGSARSAP